MTANYPTSIRSFATKVDLIDTVIADNVNSLQEEVVAIETTLGSAASSKNPLVSSFGGTTFTTTMNGTGGLAWATVYDRLTNIENGLLNGGMSNPPYVPKTGGATITSSGVVGLTLKLSTGTLSLLETYTSSNTLMFNITSAGVPRVGTNNVLYVGSTEYTALGTNTTTAQTTATAAVPKTAYTALGDLLVGSGSGTYSVLGKGTSGQALVMNGTSVSWGTPTDTTKVPLSTVTTTGDLILGNGNGVVTRLAVGAAGTVLTSAGTGVLPTWSAPSSAYVSTTNGAVTTAATSSGVVRNIYVNTAVPSTTTGYLDGDIWLVYF